MNKALNYTINDLNVLEKDSDNNPTSFTPLFEIPGEIYSQDYPKRLRHSFPKNSKWTEEIEFQNQQVEKWKKHVFERYIDV